MIAFELGIVLLDANIRYLLHNHMYDSKQCNLLDINAVKAQIGWLARDRPYVLASEDSRNDTEQA
jgi:hypothetical protein